MAREGRLADDFSQKKKGKQRSGIQGSAIAGVCGGVIQGQCRAGGLFQPLRDFAVIARRLIGRTTAPDGLLRSLVFGYYDGEVAQFPYRP